MKKNLFLLFFLLGIWQQTFAQQFVSGDLVYEITSPTTVKLSYQDPNLAGSIIIPASIDYDNQSYTVTVIDDYSFYGLLITSVVIPNTVTTIGYAAFSDCGSLTSVTIPNSVTEIGDYAFSLSGLTSVICNATTPPNIYFNTFSIGTLSSCSVTVPIASLTNYQAAPFWQNFNTVIGDGVLNTTTVSACSSYTWANTNQTYTVTGVYTGTTTNGVTEQLDLTIQSNFSMDGINYVVTSPTTVSVDATGNATGAVVIPATVTSACGTYTVTSINTLAFAGSSGLTSITIPNSVTNIGIAAFAGCTGLTSVICNVSEPINIDPSVFSGVNLGNCTLTVPNGSVGAYQDAFVWENFDSISSNVVFNTTTVSACSSYTWENNNETYTATGVYTGTTTNGVTEQLDLTILSNFSVDGINYAITSPNTVAVDVTSDATGAVVIPATVTSSCGTYGVTSINYAAFAGSSLTSVIIPNSVTNIDPAAFVSCTGLTSVTIPNSVTNIGPAAFGNCSSLTSVTIGNSVTSIGAAAFAGCTNLTSIVCNVSIPINIDPSVFGGVNQAGCSLTVPAGSVGAYKDAFVWEDFRFPNNNLSKVIDSQCGTTLSAINTLIYANAISGASAYRFKVTNGATTEIIEPTSGRGVRLTSLLGGTLYNTTYTISVAVKKNNVWGEYGEECTVTTPESPAKIQEAQCGTTLNGLNSPIFSVAKYGATGYRFEITNGGTVYTYDSVKNYFRLPEVNGPLAKYGESFSIRVSIQLYGLWQPYGASCTINTPASPIKVQDAQCGTTLAGLNSPIIATAGSYADTTGYRFEVTSGTNVYIYDSVKNYFNLTQLNVPAVQYGASYSIRVSIKLYGIWQPYGTSCTINTPLAPLTQLQASQCGITLNSTNTTLLYANSVAVAQKYRFEVSLGANVYIYETPASTSVRSFKMTTVPGLTLVAGTTYGIRVAIMANGQWQPYGASCNVTTYGVAPVILKTPVEPVGFNVMASPSPFTENFTLRLTTATEDKVTVMVYDMTGKLMEKKEVVPSELSELQVGNDFSSGVYNVIVSQGENVKTMRVIKR